MANNKERNVVDLTSLQLKAKPPAGAKRPAALAVKSWKNKPSLTVFSNVEGAPKYGIFGVNLYPYLFMTFLEGMKRIANSPFTPGEVVTRKLVIFDKATNDKQRQGDLVFGRDKEGVMYVCLISADDSYPKIPFMFTPPRTTEYQGVSIVEASQDYCLGCVSWWEQLMPKHIMDNFVDETLEPRPGQGGGYNNGGGGGYNNNGGGNNYERSTDNNSSTPVDDDLPF